ncbi:ExbD/TolR family protein [Candidatus Paracaedibacter symbiosus]|uniref:ExbD/TolR family protein n=1 Tax=Candidatus Paracaedibacter symbiosus TaxID=244582 RepID=UPI00094F0AD1|nr:biopolymer transporter ExbD [Candidatus Paracaedibacter symbiosus]
MGVSVKSNNKFQRRRRGGTPFTDINVTPMVDVMLVLLIVFMVTAPMLTVGVPVDLPKTKAAKLTDQVEPIVISVDAAGKSFLQEMELEGEALVARLMAITGSNPDARIYVRGDKGLAYGRIMEIMGEVAAAGFTKVSLIAEMPMGSAKSQATVKPALTQGQVSPQPKPGMAAPKRVAPNPAIAPVKTKPVAQPAKPAVKKGQ